MGTILFTHVSLYLLVLVLVLSWISWSFRKNQFFNREKSSVFECGFDTFNSARVSFSIRFFFLLLLFLVFDVELTVLLQLPLFQKESLFNNFFLLLTFFLLLIGGLGEEWRRGILKWSV